MEPPTDRARQVRFAARDCPEATMSTPALIKGEGKGVWEVHDETAKGTSAKPAPEFMALLSIE